MLTSVVCVKVVRAAGLAFAEAGEPSPLLFTARTWKVYSVPFMRLGTVTDCAVPAEFQVVPDGTDVPAAWRYS